MKKKDRLLTMGKEWLHQKSKLFAKYAINMPLKVDVIDLQLDYPDNGWIDFHILINGEEKVLIDTSYVYEPFAVIKEWLEAIVLHLFDFTPSGININNESNNYLLYYEAFPHLTDELLTPTPPELCGLFYIYDSQKGKIVADAICETKEFVRNTYEKIMEFAISTRESENFIDDWCWQAYNKECSLMWENNDPEIKNIFVKKVSSVLIEDFLSGENNARQFIQIQ